ncbi:MAG: phage tail tube protein [Bermanella sp.]|jgi:Bacterial surface proteins containing Ig-like domains
MSTTKPTKGAGTSFWRLNTGTDIASIVDFTEDTLWTQIAQVKDIQPGEITVEDEEEEYLDTADNDYNSTTPGKKDAGETSLTIAWMPGDASQKQLVTDVDDGTKTWYRIKYPNAAVDCYFGYINSLGKSIAIKDKMQRSIKIKNCNKPKLAEDLLA